MPATYSLQQADRYCASVGFFGATREVLRALAFEITQAAFRHALRFGQLQRRPPPLSSNGL